MEKASLEQALDRFLPLSCVYVISVNAQGEPSGMIASWVIQTSFNPPLIAVSIGKTRFTYNLIKDSKEFVIAVPNEKLKEAIRIFGLKSGANINKFKETNLKTKKASFVKSPLLADATINYECKLLQIVDTGDHSIFIGEVMAAWMNKNKKVLLNMGKVKGKRIFKEF
jgi:flavin reductase (DIM6/NTAB) family NADH-FMN oxidoreductase RutF